MKTVYVDTAAENEALSVALNVISNQYPESTLEIVDQETNYPLTRFQVLAKNGSYSFVDLFVVDLIHFGENGKVKLYVALV
ncbi:hypothetical protein NSU02_08030 [Aeribacillus sp. FSL W8-0870]|uniref:hypothetical protein n=1 Tax=Aeribacillus sp. FSL W8-0870 TaxID=2954706 RepID=UPI0030CDFF9A